jgi:hypothetical protein
MSKETSNHPKEIALKATHSGNPKGATGDTRRKPWESVAMQPQEWPVLVTLATHGPGEAPYRVVPCTLLEAKKPRTPGFKASRSTFCLSPCTQ